MEAFTDTAGLVGIPTVATGAHFQQPVKGLTVTTNVSGVVTGTDLEGAIEFWPNNYGPQNGADVAGASGERYDCGDQPSGPADGYGSMQVHHPETRQTLFAINRWKAGGAGADVGIGCSTLSAKSSDWTFAANGGSYRHKRLRVFVRAK
jgi:sialate O-acetylesterase